MTNFLQKGAHKKKIPFSDHCPGNGIGTNSELEQNIHFK